MGASARRSARPAPPHLHLPHPEGKGAATECAVRRPSRPEGQGRGARSLAQRSIPAMTREQLAHVLRAAATIVDDGEILIIGSQAILGTLPEVALPDEAT